MSWVAGSVRRTTSIIMCDIMTPVGPFTYYFDKLCYRHKTLMKEVPLANDVLDLVICIRFLCRSHGCAYWGTNKHTNT